MAAEDEVGYGVRHRLFDKASNSPFSKALVIVSQRHQRTKKWRNVRTPAAEWTWHTWHTAHFHSQITFCPIWTWTWKWAYPPEFLCVCALHTCSIEHLHISSTVRRKLPEETLERFKTRKITCVTVLFLMCLSLRKMTELTDFSNHIYDQISSVKRMLDLSVAGEAQSRHTNSFSIISS